MDLIYLMEREGRRRNLSRNTIMSYCRGTRDFLKYIGKEPRRITRDDILSYLDKLSLSGASPSTLNVALCSIKFAGQTMRKSWRIDIRYSKRPKRLPTVLSRDEVRRLLLSIKNIKHRIIACLLYSAGLRVSEAVNLKVRDLHIDEGYGWVRGGKGNKDRMFIIADKMKGAFRRLTCEKSPDSFIFQGNKGRMSTRTVYAIIKQAARDASISKNVHPHTLRHCFATHVIEDGHRLTDLQPLLGHESIETTGMYVHLVPKIHVRSPLDTL